MSSLAASMTTTSAASKKTSWLTMAPCRWPEPELSIGAPREALDPFGRYNCWSVSETCPVNLMWKTVSKTIRSLLKDQIEHLDARGSALHVEIFMIGRRPSKSSPTVLFCSENKTLRRKAMELVERKVISGAHPGVLVAHASRLPRLLALGDDEQLSRLPEGVYAASPLKSMGISIYIVAKGASPRRATIGGFVSIQSQYYGLTTAHAFLDSGSSSLEKEPEFEFGFGMDEPEDSSDDDDYLLELTSKGSVSSNSSDVYNSSSNCDGDLAETVISDASTIRGTEKKGQIKTDQPTKATFESSLGQSLIKIGTLHATSKPNTGLDWALVKIDQERLVSLTPDRDTKDKHGWTETSCRILNNEIWKIALKQPRLPKISVANNVHDAKILICTGRNDVPWEGFLSGVSSFMKGPESTTFQELWTVKLDKASLIDGDCGSWVLDAQNGGVYGHVVSGYRQSGTLYLVPAHQIVQDIQKQLGNPVEFPVKRCSKTLWSSKKQVGDTSRNSPATTSKPSIQHKSLSMTSPGPPPPPPPSIGRATTGPPPPPGIRPSGPLQSFGRPPPPPPGLPMPMPIRQQIIGIQDITPPKMMDASSCLKKLTTYAVFTIRKCPPRDQEKPTWARSEIMEEQLAQDEIVKQVKYLNEKGKSVSDKTNALAPNQQGQIAALIADQAGREADPSFEWTLVQFDSVQKPVSSKVQGSSRKPLYETVTMTAYMKRAPKKDVDPVALYQRIEKKKRENTPLPTSIIPLPTSIVPLPTSMVQQNAPPAGALKTSAGDGKVTRTRGPKKYIEGDDYSTGDSYDSDTNSASSSGSIFSSNDTSISSKSRSRSRRHSHRAPRSRSWESRINVNPFHSPERRQSYIPVDIPRIPVPIFDPIVAAYEAGKADAEAERYATARRQAEWNFDRVVEPRAVVSYGRMEPRIPQPGYSEARFMDRDKGPSSRTTSDAFYSSKSPPSGVPESFWRLHPQESPLTPSFSPFSPSPNIVNPRGGEAERTRERKGGRICDSLEQFEAESAALDQLRKAERMRDTKEAREVEDYIDDRMRTTKSDDRIGDRFVNDDKRRLREREADLARLDEGWTAERDKERRHNDAYYDRTPSEPLPDSWTGPLDSFSSSSRPPPRQYRPSYDSASPWDRLPEAW